MTTDARTLKAMIGQIRRNEAYPTKMRGAAEEKKFKWRRKKVAAAEPAVSADDSNDEGWQHERESDEQRAN
jgi:hypothetical protein